MRRAWNGSFFGTGGFFNTATGAQALFANTGSDTTGSANTATGYQALFENTTGNENTATGVAALALNSTGDFNTADGAEALNSNTSGTRNTATGLQALNRNTVGDDNSAFGWHALESNIVGSSNTAVGFNTLSSTTGGFNTAVGRNALVANTTGESNIAIGFSAGSALTTGGDNIDIVNGGVAGESNTVRIGSPFVQFRAFISGIRGAITGNNNAIPVVIDSVGQLGTVSSSRRYKTDVKPMDKASEAILALKPVSFRYKVHKDTTPQFGLIAEEVAEVNPDLVVRDENGEIYTVRYEAVNAMLLNEFLKEHKKVEKQETTITQLKNDFQTVSTQQRKEIQLLSAQLKEQAAQIQKVSAQLATASPSRGGLEASKPAAQVVNNP